jgi:uncharacterized lipoprotein YajG
MKKILCLTFALAMLAACNDSSSSPDVDPAKGDGPEAAQQDEITQQKLTIEQAAEEATKLIEADAKAEMEAAAPTEAETGQ